MSRVEGESLQFLEEVSSEKEVAVVAIVSPKGEPVRLPRVVVMPVAPLVFNVSLMDGMTPVVVFVVVLKGESLR